MKAFARFKTKIWCMDLPYVDELAKDNSGVMFLLVRQTLSDGTVEAKEMKTKDSTKKNSAFLTMITKKNHTAKIWVEKRTITAEEFQKLCIAVRKQLYSTMIDAATSFVERTKRSLKKYFTAVWEIMDTSKPSQFVTTLNFRENCSTVLIPKNIKTSDFCPFCTARYYENIGNAS